MEPIAFIRLMLVGIMMIVLVPVIDKARARKFPVWAAIIGFLIVMVFFWFAFGLIGGLYAN